MEVQVCMEFMISIQSLSPIIFQCGIIGLLTSRPLSAHKFFFAMEVHLISVVDCWTTSQWAWMFSVPQVRFIQYTEADSGQLFHPVLEVHCI